MLQNIDRNDELRFQNRQGPQWGWNYPDALFVGKAQCDIFHLIFTISPKKYTEGVAHPKQSCYALVSFDPKEGESYLSKEALHTKSVLQGIVKLLKPTNFEIQQRFLCLKYCYKLKGVSICSSTLVKPLELLLL